MGEIVLHPFKILTNDLRNPRLGKTEFLPDLIHGQALIEVEEDNLAILLFHLPSLLINVFEDILKHNLPIWRNSFFITKNEIVEGQHAQWIPWMRPVRFTADVFHPPSKINRVFLTQPRMKAPTSTSP